MFKVYCRPYFNVALATTTPASKLNSDQFTVVILLQYFDIFFSWFVRRDIFNQNGCLHKITIINKGRYFMWFMSQGILYILVSALTYHCTRYANPTDHRLRYGGMLWSWKDALFGAISHHIPQTSNLAIFARDGTVPVNCKARKTRSILLA